MGIKNTTDFLLENLDIGELPNILDVGANPLSPPPYQYLAESENCNVIGFEPQEAAFAKLQELKGKHEVYFNNAIGNGKSVNLNIYKSSGFTSIFPICKETIEYLDKWREGTRLLQRVEMVTTVLDEIADLPPIDLFKMDIQGGELEVFRNAKKTLAACTCVIPEVSFIPLYERPAPSFSDIHEELVASGFILHKFLFQKRVSVGSSQSHLIKNKSQLVDGDAVYIRDIRFVDNLDDRKIILLALFANSVFDSPDLTAKCLDILVGRGVVKRNVVAKYAELIVKEA